MPHQAPTMKPTMATWRHIERIGNPKPVEQRTHGRLNNRGIPNSSPGLAGRNGPSAGTAVVVPEA
jgi:hypothetical protein